MKKLRRVLLFGLGFTLALLVRSAFADDPANAKDCLSAEAKDGYTMLTNKCGQTVNVFWKDASDACKTNGCSQKLSTKAYYYIELLKDPYVLAACYAPQEVDPKWDGVGVATCKDQ